MAEGDRAAPLVQPVLVRGQVARQHALRGERGRLLAGTALAVDRGGRDGLGEPGREDGVAGDVERLLARLGDAPADDVVDLGRIDPGAATSSWSTVASRSTGCTPLSAPPCFPFPDAVRTASTMTASGIGLPFVGVDTYHNKPTLFDSLSQGDRGSRRFSG